MKRWRAELGDLRDPLVDMAVRFTLRESGFTVLPEAARFISRLVAVLTGWPARSRIIDDDKGRWVDALAKPYDGDIEFKDWGTVDIIAETDRVGLYRLNLFPGATLPDHAHYQMSEAELIISHGLVGWAGDTAPRHLRAGEHRRWPHGLPHGYHNPSFEVASLLCIDAPRFIPTDEVETGRPIDLSGI